MAFGLVVLVSGTGSLLQALLEACTDPAFGCEVRAVGSDRDHIQALRRAEAAGVPTFVHPLPPGADRDAWDAGLAEQVARFDPDLVVSAGFMKLVGRHFLARFGGRMINTHPALLPAFPGMHGARDALAYGVKISGATVILVDEGVDTGQILAQAAVDVLDGDTVDSLHDRIKVEERRLLLETVHHLARAPQPATRSAHG